MIHENTLPLYSGCAISAYSVYAVSHEAALLKTKQDEPRFKDFVFVGTSGLGVMRYLFQLADYSKEHTPKLYILDYSASVQSFWFTLKDIAEKATTCESFYDACSKAFPKDARKINEFIESLVTQQILKETHREQAFDLLRRVIVNCSIICEDWANKDVFNYINATKTKDVPVFVFASNIIEFMDRRCYVDDTLKNDPYDPASLILENIESLNPYYTYHTRTSWESRENYINEHIKTDSHSLIALLPDTVVRVGKNENVLERLKSKDYVNFLRKQTLQSNLSNTCSVKVR